MIVWKGCLPTLRHDDTRGVGCWPTVTVLVSLEERRLLLCFGLVSLSTEGMPVRIAEQKYRRQDYAR